MTSRRPLVNVSGSLAELPEGDLIPAEALGTGTADSTTVLHGDGVYRTPAGGGGGDATGLNLNASIGPTPEFVAVKQSGLWYQMSWATFVDAITGAPAPTLGYLLTGAGRVVSPATNDISVTEKHVFDTGVVSSGTALQLARQGSTGFGNHDIGMIAGGMTGSNTYQRVIDRYQFANESVSPNNLLTVNMFLASGTGPDTGEYAVVGANFTGVMAATNKVDFASGITSAGSNLTQSVYGRVALGYSAFGIWAGGVPGPVSTTSKYTWASDTTAAATSLATARYYASAIQAPSFGLVATGSDSSTLTATVERYTYATDAVAAATTLEYPTTNATSGNDAAVGLIAGGSVGGGQVQRTQRYELATDTTSVTTDLLVGRYRGAGVSSSPGHI